MNRLAQLTLVSMLVLPGSSYAAPKSALIFQQQIFGTQQMEGTDASFGREYTLGKMSPINVVIRETQFALGWQGAGALEVPSADEQLLVIRYTLHNPQKEPIRIAVAELEFIAVDSRDQNYKNLRVMRRDGTVQGVESTLMPAQKIDLYTGIIVPARQVQVPKLIVMRGAETAPVLRYDLRGGTKPLPKELLDESGFMKSVVQGGTGMVYPLAIFDVIVDGARSEKITADSKDVLPDLIPQEGYRIVTVPVTLRNRSIEDMRVRENMFAGTMLESTAGRKYEANLLLAPTLDEKYDGLSKLNLRSGETARAVFAFHIRERDEVKTLHILEQLPRPGEDVSRMISVDLASPASQFFPGDSWNVDGNRRFPGDSWRPSLRTEPWSMLPTGIFNPVTLPESKGSL
jgi:hypothetical protein